MKKGGRVRQITTGRALKEEDDKTCSVREESDLIVHHDAPVDFERLWKNIRTDSDIFWRHFLPTIQAKLCPSCLKAFQEVYEEARRKGFGVDKAKGGLEADPPSIHH